MAKRSNELERLAHEAVEHQARHAQKKAAAFLGVLISNAQHDGSTSDGLSRKQRASVCDLPKNQSPRRKDGKETGEQATILSTVGPRRASCRPTRRGSGNRNVVPARAKMPFPIHQHMLRHGCGYALANAGHDTRALQ